MRISDVRSIGLLACAALTAVTTISAAQGPPASWTAGTSVQLRSARDSSPPTVQVAPPTALGGHPLAPALQFARVRYDYLQAHVRDFSCILIKRERIEGRLHNYEYIKTEVRLRQVRDGRIVVPLSVRMEYLAPAQYSGRKVLYVEGQNEGKMIVRNGGQRFGYVTVRVAPDSQAALRESRYPITELSLETVARRLIEKVEDDIKFDPTGTNTKMTFFRDAKVDGRPCTRIQVVHPRPDGHLSFHIADVYVDDELRVPIRVEGYDWPRDDESDAPLLEEYTFRRLRLNIGLTPADFSLSLLQN